MELKLDQFEQRVQTFFHQSLFGIASFSSEGKLLNANEKFSVMARTTKDQLKNKTFREIFDLPDDEPEIFSASENNGTIKEPYNLCGTLSTSPNLQSEANICLIPNFLEGLVPGSVLCLIEDVTYTLDCARSAAWLNEIDNFINEVQGTNLELKETTQVIARASRKITNCTASMIVLEDQDEDFSYSGGTRNTQNYLENNIPIKEKLIGRALEENKLVTSDNIETDHRVNNQELPEEIDFTSMLALPLTFQGETFGALVLLATKEDFFTDNHRQLLSLISGFISSRINYALRFRDKLIQSETDDLTGLKNRGKMKEILQEEMERCDRYDHPLSVIMLDIDHFKLVNDSHGHVVGDQILSNTADILFEECRIMDLPTRYGGEEFLIIMPEIDLAGSKEIANKIRNRMAEADFEGAEGEDLRVTISGGVAEYSGNSMETLITKADEALYASKENGRNQILSYDEITSSAEEGETD